VFSQERGTGAALGETVVVYENGRVSQIVSPTRHDAHAGRLPTLRAAGGAPELPAGRIR
jgi:hypothetical protein